MYINKFIISVIFKCTIQWLKYIHIFVQENNFLTMVNVHYNWVEKIELKDKSVKYYFFKSPETVHYHGSVTGNSELHLS